MKIVWYRNGRRYTLYQMDGDNKWYGSEQEFLAAFNKRGKKK
jgi:hypothetical protein